MTDTASTDGAAGLASTEAVTAALATPDAQTADATTEAPASDAQPETGAEALDDTVIDLDESEPDSDGKPKPKGGFQRKLAKQDSTIQALTREKFELEQQKRLLQQQLEQTKTSPKSQTLTEMPVIENYSDLGKFQTDLIEWGKLQGQKAAEEAVKAAEEEQKRSAEEQKQISIRATVQQRELTFAQQKPDYFQSVAPYAQIVNSNPALQQYLVESDMAPDVFYAMSKNPELFDSVSRMTPYAAARALIKLETKLSSAPPPKPLSNAPAPIKPVGTADKLPRKLADLATEDVAAYIARRNKQAK